MMVKVETLHATSVLSFYHHDYIAEMQAAERRNIGRKGWFRAHRPRGMLKGEMGWYRTEGSKSGAWRQ